ncbi:MAG: response regulator [Bacteroidales bacterium]|nr:response regulator [Bacteroidales bacterium]
MKKKNIIDAKKHFKFKWDDKVILIADDLKVNFILLQAMLEETQANILWVKNGKQALDECTTNESIDLVLMDYNMPEMNGYEATVKIKSFRNNLPVISHSSCSVGTPEFENISATCDDYIVRPICKDSLLTKIEKYLNNAHINL